APLGQISVRHRSYFLDRWPKRALTDPDNLHILVDHVKCAAVERPFTGAEAFGARDLREILGILAEQGLVHRTSRAGPFGPADVGSAGEDSKETPTDAQWTWTNESYPADAVSLRSVSSDNFVIVDTTEATRDIGETDFTS